MTDTAFTYKDGHLYAENVRLEDIARKVGTPCYINSTAQIEVNYNAFKNALGSTMPEADITICYATKANSSLAVLKTLARLGSGADIVSGGELERAIRSNIPASKIVFSGVGKTHTEIKRALELGVMQINVESWQELEAISQVATSMNVRAPVAFRVNPDVDAKTHAKITTGKKENKFGIDIAHAPMMYLNAQKIAGIDLTGVAVHIGSQLTDLAPYRVAFTKVAELVRTLDQSGIALKRIDLGGGLGIRYKDETPPDLMEYARIIRDTVLPLNRAMVIEPGRAIAGNAGVLLSRVLYIKEGVTKKYLIIDAAMNDLARPALYDAYHPVWPCTKTNEPKINYDIVGPVCETGDTFHVDEPMSPLGQNDLVALMVAGAYGAAMSSNYNTRPLAPEVIVKGNKFFVTRPRESIDEMLACEKTPEWLA